MSIRRRRFSDDCRELYKGIEHDTGYCEKKVCHCGRSCNMDDTRNKIDGKKMHKCIGSIRGVDM